MDIPVMYRGIFEKAPKSRANAIKAMCLQCVGYVRKDVTDCACKTCPLWGWRPYQEKKSD